MKLALKAENIAKAYHTGSIGAGTLNKDLIRWKAKIMGKEDPFLTFEQINQASRDKNGIIWPLKDVNFEIEKGDTIAISGNNGAGKSTLLKILSRVTCPTKGRITGNGKITSLLEIGTGFHPELTGMENIFLNGAILGMRRVEIKRNIEAIIDFSALSTYIHTPIKRYSSGMYLRLAFSVAAHLQSDTLLLDEIFAVGDEPFQNQCYEKIKSICKEEGRTILLVSHDKKIAAKLCKKEIRLINGYALCSRINP